MALQNTKYGTHIEGISLIIIMRPFPPHSRNTYRFHGLLGLLYPCWPGFWGEIFSLPIKVPFYLPRKDERFGMPWRDLNSQHYDYKRVALPTELSHLFKIF